MYSYELSTLISLVRYFKGIHQGESDGTNILADFNKSLKLKEKKNSE